MRTTLSPHVAILLIGLIACPTAAQRLARDERAPIDPARVLSAIDRGVGYLKRQQTGRGAWDDMSGYPGGATALCALALLNAGIEPADSTISKALDYLRQIEPRKTYVVSLQTMAYCAAEPARDRARIAKLARWLEKAQQKEGPYAGGWGYESGFNSADPSNSQFALLALYEAQQAGAEVKEETWRRAAAYWRKRQNENGSWSYQDNASDLASGSMTCAGVGALLIADLAQSAGDARVEGGRVLCCQPHKEDDAIERGVAWLGRNFSVRGNPAGGRVRSQWHYYYLYALERAGRLSARRFIGLHDWYREGTEQLVRSQDSLSDSWSGAELEGQYPQVTTALALLFLSKGRRPVVMAKAHQPEAPDPEAWDRHRRDAAHLSSAASKAWGLPMTWQRVDPLRASATDLKASPILYLSGDAVSGVVGQGPKLREYLDQGGFLLAESPCDGGAPASRTEIERLVSAIFPEPEYQLKRLPSSHPLWRMERLVRPDSDYVGSLWGVEYGCRTCMVFCDRDLSCYWELDSPASRDELPPKIRQRVDDAQTVGLNVLAYATNREPRGKEQQFVEQATRLDVDGPNRRGVIEIAKLRHTGGCNDAPGALANLLRAASQGETRLSVAPTPVEVAPDDPALPRWHFAFMHGRRDFKLSPQERRALRDYLMNGGTLLADSICASSEFTTAFRRELGKAIPGARIERIPASDPLLTEAYGGYDIRVVELRDPQPVADNQPLAARVRRTSPVVEGIRIDDRWAVVFSPYDLSCALEQHEAIECRGYRREDAARIGLNVLLYSINQ